MISENALPISDKEWIVLDAAASNHALLDKFAPLVVEHSHVLLNNREIFIPIKQEEAANLIETCMNKGLIQIVSQEALRNMMSIVQQDGSIGPIYGYPDLGTVDLTEEGAVRYKAKAIGHYFPDNPASIGYRHVSTSIFADPQAAESFSASIDPTNGSSDWNRMCSKVVEVGPWRKSWWYTHSMGYAIQIIDERSVESSLRHPTVEPIVELDCQDPIDPDSMIELPEFPEQSYVTRGEWLVLTHVALGLNTEIDFAVQIQNGFLNQTYSLSLQECRYGLASCQRKGWVRRVDSQFCKELDQMMGKSSVLNFIQQPPIDDSFEFTDAGAAVFVGLCDVSSKNLLASDCVTQLTVDGKICLFETLQEAMDYFQQNRIVWWSHHFLSLPWEIGPWCTTWWDRHQSGYGLRDEQISFYDWIAVMR